MGAGRVREMIFTARLIGAEEAQGCGLISEVLADEADLMARAEALADTLAQMAPLTLRATKEAMRRVSTATRVEDADLIEMCYMSRDFRHGIEAFLAKQKPEWSGT
jgi:enoyl-CoA hydratase/carnithine racemase